MSGWEYCLLALREAQYHEGKGWTCDCWIDYYGPNGYEQREVGKLGQFFGSHPFREAMCALARDGWELVSVQHGNYAHTLSLPIPKLRLFGQSDEGEEDEPAYQKPALLCRDSVMAYFKRPAPRS